MKLPSRPFALHPLGNAAFLTLVVASAAFAQTSVQDFVNFSMDELLSETVTSVSKRRQPLFEAASAISVISNDDIRRSGAVYVADTFRSIPGMNVASVNSSQWGVSARGFNAVYTNKLLVLIDGRPIYHPLFAGVSWEMQQPMLDDVDRIEVIRGPGATIWGANAVNGVINIVSLSARDTQGGLLYGAAGDLQQTSAGARFGGKAGENTYYRVFAAEQSRDGFVRPGTATTDKDDWKTVQGGFRIDHYASPSRQLTWQADATQGDFRAGANDALSFNTLARLTHQFGDGEQFEIQAFYDHLQARETYPSDFTIETFDISAERTFRLSERNTLIWGAGYRHISTLLENPWPTALIRSDKIDQDLFTTFAQNEFAWIPNKFTLTAGLKLEHNDYTGAEVQPSVRAVFLPADKHAIWAAVSRATRTPNQLEGADAFALLAGAPFPGPGGFYVPALVGNANPKAETLWAFEAGYRTQALPRLSLDIATFYNVYDDLITYGPITGFEPGVPFGVAEIPQVNIAGSRTYGVEVSAIYTATDTLRFRAAYSILCHSLDAAPGYYTGDFERSPRNQLSLGTSWDLTRWVNFDLQTRYVEESSSIPGYVTADVRIAWRPTSQLELALVGSNLLEPSHLEQAPELFTRTNEVPRNMHGKVTWKF